LDIFILPQEVPQDNQYLVGNVYWAGIDKVLSREEEARSQRASQLGSGRQRRRQGQEKCLG
jgi:hypothetical protein